MRRAIVEFVTNIQQNPNQTSRHMFIWGHTRTSLGYFIPIDFTDTMLRGLLRWGQGRFLRTCWGVLWSGSKSEGYGDRNHPHPILSTHSEYSLSDFPVWETWPPHSVWRLPCIMRVCFRGIGLIRTPN
jgi:hypothetical protein